MSYNYVKFGHFEKKSLVEGTIIRNSFEQNPVFESNIKTDYQKLTIRSTNINMIYEFGFFENDSLVRGMRVEKGILYRGIFRGELLFGHCEQLREYLVVYEKKKYRSYIIKENPMICYIPDLSILCEIIYENDTPIMTFGLMLGDKFIDEYHLDRKKYDVLDKKIVKNSSVTYIGSFIEEELFLGHIFVGGDVFTKKKNKLFKVEF